MNLSQAYLQDRQQWLEEGKLEGLQEGKLEGLQEGKLEGLQEGKLQLIENLLKVRFQNIDDELKQVLPMMLNLPDDELSPLLLTLNREELLMRFKSELN